MTSFHHFRIWLLAFLGTTALAPAHEFSNSEGKKLVGEIQSVTKDNFVIETADKKRLTIPLAKVIPADQAYVAEWKKANPDIKLNVSAIKERAMKGPPTPTGRMDTIHWKITIKNETPNPVENLKLTYLQVKEVKDEYAETRDQKLKPFKEVGELDVEKIPPFGSVTMNTTDISVGSYYGTNSSGYTEKWSSDLTALNTEVRWGERPVASSTIGNYSGLGSGRAELKKKAEAATAPEEDRTEAKEELKEKRKQAQADRDGEKLTPDGKSTEGDSPKDAAEKEGMREK